jgi:hypothetical protein
MIRSAGRLPVGVGLVSDIEPDQSHDLDMAVFCADTDDGVIKTHLLIDSQNGITVLPHGEHQVGIVLTGQKARDRLVDLLNGVHEFEYTTFMPFLPDD